MDPLTLDVRDAPACPRQLEQLLDAVGRRVVLVEPDGEPSLAPDLPIVASFPGGRRREGLRTVGALFDGLGLGHDDALVYALVAQGRRVWPELRARAARVGDDVDRIGGLSRVFAWLPPPLHEPLFEVSRMGPLAPAWFLGAAEAAQPDAVALAAVQLVQSPDPERRSLGLDSLHHLASRMGQAVVGDPVHLPSDALDTLAERLGRDPDEDYVLGQVLLRSQAHVARAVPALAHAVAVALADDLGASDGMLSYDLGCDLQNVAAAFGGVGTRARIAVPLLVRIYDGGDLSLRRAVLGALGRIGGLEARRAVTRWCTGFEAAPPAVPDAFVVGHRAALRAAKGWLEREPAASLLGALLALTDRSFVAGAVLDDVVERLHGHDPVGVEALLRRASGHDDALRRATAHAALQRLGLEPPAHDPAPPHRQARWVPALRGAALRLREG